ncbi:TPA: LPXTG cell wall anchor domain-containing protein, partial [Streptococcus suis]|nr:LPXTG cell wall anchor domain-containing protein [Streptococcus suis]HEM4734774.1 LPXTG cell wall anchor domain-containing protein [Streptococcus suis]HEM4789455.1 LPXTG cell wall anchor domain-containing protein [Streptococcus suis]HEM4911442.1 LPXTG cell wall anchor domain-containing protein [Streptococcus suis]
ANEEVATAKNDKDGNVKFKELTFDKAGTYTYTVTEVVGGDTAIIYDSLKIKVTVVVTDDGEGKLIAKVEYPEDIEFNNEYVEPTTTTTTEEPTTTTTTEEPMTTTTTEEPMTTITSEKTRKTALPSTGDKGNIWVAIAGFVALITIVVMVYYRKSKNA